MNRLCGVQPVHNRHRVIQDDEIRRVLGEIAKEPATAGRDFSAADKFVALMKSLGELDEAAIVKFVGAGKFDEVSAALAVLNGVPTELIARVVEGTRADLLLIPCKAIGLDWASAVTARSVPGEITEATVRTRTSVGSGAGRGTSRTSTGPPAIGWTICFMSVPRGVSARARRC